MMKQMAAPTRERSLYSMMEHLLSLDDSVWHLYAWSRDPLEGKFTREQKLAYGSRAAECGRNEAELLKRGQMSGILPPGWALRYPRPRCRWAEAM